MSEQTEPIEPDSAPPANIPPASTTPAAAPAATTPAATPAPTAPVARRSVTLPLLPFAIVGGVIVALLFFGGGVALGYGVASHDGGRGNMQHYRGGDTGGLGFGAPNGNGFAPGQNPGGPNQQNPDRRPGDRPTTAPKNG